MENSDPRTMGKPLSAVHQGNSYILLQDAALESDFVIFVVWKDNGVIVLEVCDYVDILGCQDIIY